MRRLLFSFALLLSAFALKAQIPAICTFDSLYLSKADTYYVNNTAHMTDLGFTENNVHFPYYWDNSFGGFFSSGFLYSNMQDSVTSGYMNQYAAKTNGGYNGSANYLVSYQNMGIPNTVYLDYSSGIFALSGFYITNSTYAYNSMRDGDFVAKKFGGVT